MADRSAKKSLPHGWEVHVSTNYPNKIYYFNTMTGDSVWECPELDPPRSVVEDQGDKEANDMFHKNSKVSSPEMKDGNPEKSSIPPTAIVTPVVYKSKKEASPIQASEKKISMKRKINFLSENPHETEISCKKASPEKRKKKYVSPLNKSSMQEKSDVLIDRSPSIEKMSYEEICCNSILESSDESVINDVEMRDVSVDYLDDLAEKKETVFDTTACYYIVIDTNVLIGELDLINELKDTPLDGCGPPHIFIPWVVIGELDKLKSQRIPKLSDDRKRFFELEYNRRRGWKDEKVSAAAGEAIRYLNSVLGKHPRFHGQSPAEAEAWAKSYSKNNDDKITECCLGLRNKMPSEKVILLTNDKNLVNKAIIQKINVHNFESMIKKVKPDTKFNCEEMKSAKKKKRDKEIEVQKDQNESRITPKERFLQSKRERCDREIHTIMANARLLIKNNLLKFISEEMQEAYGNIWLDFPIGKELLKDLLEAILKYWKTVFYEFLCEKDKRNIEFLLEKVRRPKGVYGDKDECLKILSAAEDLFLQIRKRRPKLNVPVELIQDHRVACVNAFTSFCEAESEFRSAEDESVREVLDDNWTVINKVCGIILDHYKISNDFDYCGKGDKHSETEIQHLMVIVYPAVQKFKRLLCDIFNAIKNSQPVKKLTKKLAAALLEFVPSLHFVNTRKVYPFFTSSALEKWLTSPQHRQKIEVGIMQINNFFSKLEEAFRVMVQPSSKTSPVL